MRNLVTAAVVALLALSNLAMDCAGGTNECSPPEGSTLSSRTLYCQEGERGYCREGGHQGDTVWEADPCPSGTSCEMANGEATCAPWTDATSSPDVTPETAGPDTTPLDATPPDIGAGSSPDGDASAPQG